MSNAGPLDLLLISGVRAADPARNLDGDVDLVVERGVITRLGKDAISAELRASERAVHFDGRGKLLLPAFVDLHAHVREPGEEYKEDIRSGLRAAAHGGFAHICAMPNTKPVNDKRSITEAIVARAREVGGPTLHPIGAITVGQLGKELTEVADLREAGAVGISDDGRCVMNAAVMRRALQYAETFDIPVIQHCEDHDLTEGAEMHEGRVSTELGLRGWPAVAEDIIVARDVLLAESTRAKYHVAHVSTRGAVRIIREAKARGIRVTAEVTPHHLLLTHDAVVGYRTACKVNPPLREEADVLALQAALADGTIDAIATDHAPHSVLEKDCEFAEARPGMVGLEFAISLMFQLVSQGKLPLARLVDALSTAPSKIIAIDPPALKEGKVAELVLFDPARPYLVGNLVSKSENTPFLGQTLQGRVLLTLARGELVHRLD